MIETSPPPTPIPPTSPPHLRQRAPAAYSKAPENNTLAKKQERKGQKNVGELSHSSTYKPASRCPELIPQATPTAHHCPAWGASFRIPAPPPPSPSPPPTHTHTPFSACCCCCCVSVTPIYMEAENEAWQRRAVFDAEARYAGSLNNVPRDSKRE